MDVVLIRVTPSGVKGELLLNRERTVFGRGEGADIRVPVSKISRKHCAISVSDDSIRVDDLGSSNGTYVNQERVESRPVSAGDLISFGGLVFVVRVNSDPAEIDAELMFEDGVPDGEDAVLAAPSSGGAGREPLVPAMDPDDSSIADFEFEMGDDEDEQPPL